MSCGVGGCRRGSDLALLWLWCRPAAVAPIWPLAWEPPICRRCSPKRQNKECKRTQQGMVLVSYQFILSIKGISDWVSKICTECIQMYFCANIYTYFFLLFWLYLQHMEVPGPGIKSKLELQPMAKLRQPQILNPLLWARDPTSASTKTSQIINSLHHSRNP